MVSSIIEAEEALVQTETKPVYQHGHQTATECAVADTVKTRLPRSPLISSHSVLRPKSHGWHGGPSDRRSVFIRGVAMPSVGSSRRQWLGLGYRVSRKTGRRRAGAFGTGNLESPVL